MRWSLKFELERAFLLTVLRPYKFRSSQLPHGPTPPVSHPIAAFVVQEVIRGMGGLRHQPWVVASQSATPDRSDGPGTCIKRLITIESKCPDFLKGVPIKVSKCCSQSVELLLLMTINNVVIFLVLIIAPFATSDTNYCCVNPDFGSNWCHSSKCLGLGCRNEPDPITKESQSNYKCDDLSNCICKGVAYACLIINDENKCEVTYFQHRNGWLISKHVFLYRKEELRQCENRVMLLKLISPHSCSFVYSISGSLKQQN